MQASPGIPQRVHHLLHPLTPKLVYFFNYAARAALIPFLALYYERLGLSGQQIGVLVGIPPLVALGAAPLFSGLADATGRHRQILALAILISGGLALVLPALTTFWLLLAGIFLFALALEPIMPITDQAVVESLGEGRSQYGRQRLWGAVGWGLAGPLAGGLVDEAGLTWSFYLFAGLMMGTLFSSWRLPLERVALGQSFGQGMRQLLADRRWALFLVTTFAGGVSMSLSHTYFFLYLDSLGATGQMMGLSLTIATVAELFFMYYAAQLIERFTSGRMVRIAVFIFGLRCLLYWLVGDPWLALLLQLLHGPSFAILWTAGVLHAANLAPKGLGSTAQGIFSGTLFGVSGVAGALLGGLLLDWVGPAAMYGIAGSITLGLLGVVVLLRLRD